MLVVHATKKLLDRVGTPTVEPTTRVMNEIVRLADWQKAAVGSGDDLIAVALDLSEVPTGPLYDRHVSPDRELTAVVAEAL